jgi:hypothetical protein
MDLRRIAEFLINAGGRRGLKKLAETGTGVCEAPRRKFHMEPV